jgi:beta-glucosidase
VRARDDGSGYAQMELPASYPHMKSPWLGFAPHAFDWAPRMLQKLWNVKEIYVTENGTSAEHQPSADGRIDDLDRVMFLRECLAQLHRATTEGVPVRGYFVWSLLDNFVWTGGYATRFGLHYVDYKTLAHPQAQHHSTRRSSSATRWREGNPAPGRIV